MAMRIEWTDNANKAIEHIFTCSRDYYSQKSLRALNESIKHVEKLLQDNPQLGAIEPLAEGLELEYRRIILSSPFKLIYFILNDCIFIADIWDTRMSVQRLLLHLE